MSLSVFVLIWKPVFTWEFMAFGFSGLEHTEGEFLFKVISSTFFFNLCLFISLSLLLAAFPSHHVRQMQQTWKPWEGYWTNEAGQMFSGVYPPLSASYDPLHSVFNGMRVLLPTGVEISRILLHCTWRRRRTAHRKQPQSVFASAARISTHGCYCTPWAGREAGWSLASRLSRKVLVRSPKGVLK